MSKSYHVTRRDLKDKTKKELDEMANDPDSVLYELAEKSSMKKAIKKQRKINDKRIKLNYENDSCML